MTDTPTPGDRLDSAIAVAQAALSDLRSTLAEKASEIGAEVNAKLDALQTAIDSIQAARAEPDNTLPGQMSGDPNDPSQAGGVPPQAQ